MKMSHNTAELSNICRKKASFVGRRLNIFSHCLTVSLKHAKCLDFFLPRQRDIQPEVENKSCKITKLTKQKTDKIHKNTIEQEEKWAKKIFAFSHRQSVTWLARKVSKAFNVRSYRLEKLVDTAEIWLRALCFFSWTQKKKISLRAIPTHFSIGRQINFLYIHYLIKWLTRQRVVAGWTVRDKMCIL